AVVMVVLGGALRAVAVGGAWCLARRKAGPRADVARREAVREAEQELLRQQARERVRGALAQVPSLRQRFLWDEAKSMLARARQEVDAFGLEEVAPDVEHARRELTLAARLDDTLLDRVTTSDE